MRRKKLRQGIALLISMLIIFPGTIAGAEGGSPPSALVSAVQGDVFAIPLVLYNGQTTAYSNITDPLYPRQGARLSLNDYAAVTVNGDGTYRVKLQYHSPSAVAAVQIVDPDKVDAAKTTYPTFGDMKLGTFNIATGSSLNFAVTTKGWADASYDDWYLRGGAVQFEQSAADKKLEIAYLSFDVPDLERSVLIKAYSYWSQVKSDFVGEWDLANARKIPVNISPGEYAFTPVWSNWVASNTVTQSTGRNSADSKTTFDLLIANVNAQVSGNGHMAIRVALTEPGEDEARRYIDAAERVVRRTLDPLATEFRNNLSEFFGASYETLELAGSAGSRYFVYEMDGSMEDLVFGASLRPIVTNQARVNANLSAIAYSAFLHLFPQDDVSYEGDAPENQWVKLKSGHYEIPAVLTGNSGDSDIPGVIDGAADLQVTGSQMTLTIPVRKDGNTFLERVGNLQGIEGNDAQAVRVFDEEADAEIPMVFTFTLPYTEAPVQANLVFVNNAGHESPPISGAVTLDFTQAVKIEEPDEGETEKPVFEGGIFRLRSGVADVPETAVLTAMPVTGADPVPDPDNTENKTRYMNRSAFYTYIALALDENNYLAYSISFEAGGEKIEPKNSVLEFDLPEGWDFDDVMVLVTDSHVDPYGNTTATVRQAPLVFDYEERLVRLPIHTNLGIPLNADILIINRAIAVNPVTEITSDGVYAASVVIKHVSANTISMSNAAVKEAYIERAGNGGDLRLYLRMATPEESQMLGYVADLKYYSDGLGSALLSAEHLGYQTKPDGTLEIDTEGELVFIKRISIDLSHPTEENIYYGRFFAPAMDVVSGGESGDGSGARDVRIVVLGAEKIDGVNPLAGYDRTVILAQIHIAGWLLARLPEGVGKTALSAAIDEAQGVYDQNPVGDDVILAAAANLKAAIDNVDAAGDKTALLSAVAAALQYTESAYTADSWAPFAAALAAAQAVAANTNAAQSAVDSALTALNTAAAGLKDIYSVSAADLNAAIAKAEAIQAGGYLAGSYEALAAAITAAKAVVNISGLTAERIAAVIIALNTAIDGLAAETDLNKGLTDGVYSLAGKTKLWHYSTLQSSMGNAAIDHSQSKLVVSEGGTKAEVRLFFNSLTVGSLTGYLRSIGRILNPVVINGILYSYDTEYATVYQTHTVKDKYNQNEGWLYPKEVGIEVSPLQEYTDVVVNVPVMDELGVGTQPARVWIDWSQFVSTAPDYTALSAAITEAGKVAAGGYTSASYAALTASAAAGNALQSLNGATQSLVNARAAAITAAIEALIPAASVPNEVDKSALNSKLTEANAIAKGNYTDDSWNALRSAIAVAQAVADNVTATQAQVNAQVTALNNAILNLTTVSDPGSNQPTQPDPGDGLADGVYSVATELRQYATSNLSMGHGAIDHSRSRLVVNNGQAEVRLMFQPLQQQDFVGHLLDLWRVDNIQTDSSGIITGSSRTPATVYSYYTGVTDDFGPPAGRSYPRELGIRIEIGEQYTTVQVFVPVMEAISEGTGTQYARLGLDWNSLSRIGSSIPDSPTEPARPTDPTEPVTEPEEPGEPTEPEEPGEPTDPDPSDPTEPEPGEPTDPDPVDPTEPEPGEPTEPVTEPPSTEPPDTPGPVETAPVGDGQVSVEYTQSEDTVTLVLPEDKISDIIDNSADNPVKLVSIDMSNAAGATAAVLPKEAVTRLADAALAVEIKLPQGSVTLSPEAAKSAAVQAIGGNVALEVKPVAVSSLNARQQAAVGNAPVYDISLTSDSQYITSFDGGLITIALPYTLKTGERAAGMVVWYLDDQGNIQRMNTMYDVRTQTVIFTTDHLSMYFVTYEATAASGGGGGGGGSDGGVSSAGGTGSGAAQSAPPSLVTSVAPVAPVTAALPFTDVQPSAWYYGDVAYVYSRNIMGGASASAFGPNIPMDRAMLVTVIGRLSGANVSGYAGANSFTDVIAGQYYAPYVAWARASAIIGGVGNNAFAPNAPISRQDLAVVLMNYVRYTGKPLPVKQAYNGFADEAAVAGYAKASVEAIYRAGIIGGKPGNLFDPRGSATRAEVAAILHRFVEVTK